MIRYLFFLGVEVLSLKFITNITLNLQLLNSSTYQLFNSSTPQLFNLSTYQLINHYIPPYSLKTIFFNEGLLAA